MRLVGCLHKLSNRQHRGKNGFEIVPRDDEQQFADALVELLDDDKKRSILGTKGTGFCKQPSISLPPQKNRGSQSNRDRSLS
jgi:glycosyltransferase involved in cell wall biosynthesis